MAAITGTNTGDQDLSGYATTAGLAAKANTSDMTTALATKVDKVQGKELSTNDYTTAEKTKLAAITGTNTGDQTNITGNAATATLAQTVTTNANLTGPISSVGNLTSITDGAVTDAKIASVSTSKLTGTLPVTSGGTGAASLTGLVKGNGINAFTAATAGTDYQAPLTLTTTGSGAASLNGSTLNIPAMSNGTTVGDMLYWNGTAWVKISAGSNGQILTIWDGKPLWVSTITRLLGTSNIVASPYTGRIWMDRNLGATRVATSLTDSTSYGDLYQWGRATDGHQLSTSSTSIGRSSSITPGHSDFLISGGASHVVERNWVSPVNSNLWQGVNGLNNPCPSGFRLPTLAEFEVELENAVNEGIIFNSFLKLPAAGFRSEINGLIYDRGIFGSYWTSTVVVGYEMGTNFLSLNRVDYLDDLSFFTGSPDFYARRGASVRCILD